MGEEWFIWLNKFDSIKKKYQCPVIAIGGINVNNVSEVIKSGADGAAFITGIINSQNPYSTIKKIKSKLLKWYIWMDKKIMKLKFQ